MRTNFPILGMMLVMLTGCYSYQWNTSSAPNQEAPPELEKLFASHGGTMTLDASCPGYEYSYDIGEKDDYYGNKEELLFDKVRLTLCESMPADKVLANFEFTDQYGTTVYIPHVDLLRLTPKIDSKGDMVYPELLLEEFNRFGVNFREEHGEFTIISSSESDGLERAYRANITNNCLAPGKWEFAITTEDYDEFKDRVKSDITINQNRMLSHTWFYLEPELYSTLFAIKNPEADVSLDYIYNELSDRAEQVTIDFESLRKPLKSELEIETLEIGHQSKRLIEPLDREQYWKKEFGLHLNAYEGLTYSSILDEPVSTAQFLDRGFYTEKTPKVFDLDWMRYLDKVEMNVVDVPGSDAYTQIKLTGEWTPYDVTIGNVDMALINEQKLYGLLFGMNTYPKSRRYNPMQNTIAYDAALLPADIRPFVLLTDHKTGQWVNNQYKGIEKIYLTYDDIEKDVLNVYVLCYERITPVWMASVKLPKEMREVVRIRKQLYNY